MFLAFACLGNGSSLILNDNLAGSCSWMDVFFVFVFVFFFILVPLACSVSARKSSQSLVVAPL